MRARNRRPSNHLGRHEVQAWAITSGNRMSWRTPLEAWLPPAIYNDELIPCGGLQSIYVDVVTYISIDPYREGAGTIVPSPPRRSWERASQYVFQDSGPQRRLQTPVTVV